MKRLVHRSERAIRIFLRLEEGDMEKLRQGEELTMQLPGGTVNEVGTSTIQVMLGTGLNEPRVRELVVLDG